MNLARYLDDVDQVFAEWTGEWDVSNKLTAKTVNSVRTDYGYDAAEQLISESSVTGPNVVYPYDASGKRNGSGWNTNAAGLILSSPNATYQYDVAGRRTAKVNTLTGETTLYRYNGDSQLTGVSRTNANGVSVFDVDYLYDPSGNKIRTIADPDGAGPQVAETVFHLYLGSRKYADVTGTGSLIRFFAIGDYVDEVFATYTPQTGVTWLAHDHQFTPIRSISNSGLVSEFKFDAFGIPVSNNPGTSNGIGFQGRPYDPNTGLYDFRARHLDPTTGSFVTPDPLGLAAGDPNLHNFVFNSPTNYVDPSGMVTVIEYAGLLACMTLPTALNVRSFLVGDPLDPGDQGVIAGFEAVNDGFAGREVNGTSVAKIVVDAVVNFVLAEFFKELANTLKVKAYGPSDELLDQIIQPICIGLEAKAAVPR